ncbi:hypothetical protein L0337_25945 [candidate division KSB1 bacterium]|nr:hypothetical protein [candidate division KSB1 bacterium]
MNYQEFRIIAQQLFAPFFPKLRKQSQFLRKYHDAHEFIYLYKAMKNQRESLMSAFTGLRSLTPNDHAKFIAIIASACEKARRTFSVSNDRDGADRDAMAKAHRGQTVNEVCSRQNNVQCQSFDCQEAGSGSPASAKRSKLPNKTPR